MYQMGIYLCLYEPPFIYANMTDMANGWDVAYQ